MNKKIYFFILCVSILILTGCNQIKTKNEQLFLQKYKIDDSELLVKLDYNKTYLQDMCFPAVDLTLAGNNDPTKTTYRGFTVYAFSPTNYDELETTFQYPHIEDGSMTYNVTPHFHWTMTKNLTKRECIVWGGDYSCANIDGYFNTTTTVKKTFCFDAGQTANKHIYSEMNNITLPFYSNSRQCLIRIFRDAVNTSDTLTEQAILLEFDIHYRYKKYGELIS